MSDDKELSELCDAFFKKLFARIGEDPNRAGLIKTPARVLSALHELTSGYSTTTDAFFNNALFDCENDDVVFAKKIPFYSLCEHHLLPFFGTITIAYKPNGKVIGLSKIYRIIEMFSHRLQIQETLTKQIAEEIERLTGALGVVVFVEAKHLCVAMRGAKRDNSSIETIYKSGIFKQDNSLLTNTLRSMNSTNAKVSEEQAFMQIEGINLPAFIGVNNDEKQKIQTLLVQIIVHFKKLPDACASDNINDTICYSTLSNNIYNTFAQKHFNLIETLTKEIHNYLSSAYLNKNVTFTVSTTKYLNGEKNLSSKFVISN